MKCICVHNHIRPARDSSRSEDSQLGSAGGMSTLDRSEHFHLSHVLSQLLICIQHIFAHNVFVLKLY